MQVIAHRGANREAPENSRQAMAIAIEVGADMIEFDIHVTSDGIPVVIHDENLERTTSSHGRVSEQTLAQVQRANLKNGETVPTLRDVLDLCRGKIGLNAEIKSKTPEETRLICAVLAEFWQGNPLVVSSFQSLVLQTIATDYPQFALACLMEPGEWRWPNFAQYTTLGRMLACHARILHPEAHMVDENLMDQARNRGWKVNVWYPMKSELVSRESHWGYLYHLGVDGICTNYPRQLRHWLQQVAKQEQFSYDIAR